MFEFDQDLKQSRSNGSARDFGGTREELLNASMHIGAHSRRNTSTHSAQVWAAVHTSMHCLCSKKNKNFIFSKHQFAVQIEQSRKKGSLTVVMRLYSMSRQKKFTTALHTFT
jgi:hypothetical protein